MEWPAVADLVYRGPWWKNRGIVLLNISLLLSLITSYTNGFDGSMMNGLQIVPSWKEYFNYPSSSILGFMISVQNIGALIALPMAPLASDGLGRRKALFTGATIMLGGVALQTLSTNIVHFIIARGLIGFGLCFAANAAPLLIVELAYPTQRGPITALYNSSWYIGSIIAAWVTFGTFRMQGTTWGWRIPSVLQAVPSLLQVLCIWWVPESPRWLISQGKDEQAIEVLAKYHANGNEHDPLVQYEYNEIKEALTLEKEISKSTSYVTLLATPGNRRRLRVIVGLGLFSQWSGNGLVSYYLSIILTSLGITSPAVQTLINGCLQVWNLIMAFGAALLVDRLGRRTLFLASNMGMMISFAIWTVTSALYMHYENKAAANATIAMIFVYFGFYDIAYSPLLVAYTIEILPFNIRAKGFAVMNFTVCLTLVFNQYCNPVALKKLGWKYYIVYCAWLVFEFFFIYFFLYETKGRTLEQTAALFDGVGHADSLQSVGSEAANQAQLTNHTRNHSHSRNQHEMTPPRRQSWRTSTTYDHREPFYAQSSPMTEKSANISFEGSYGGNHQLSRGASDRSTSKTFHYVKRSTRQ
jgi:sugar porter (SP) family MFS transporter